MERVKKKKCEPGEKMALQRLKFRWENNIKLYLKKWQTPIQWVAGVMWPGREADHSLTHFHSVPRLRRTGAVPPFPYMPSWCAERQLYFFTFISEKWT